MLKGNAASLKHPAFGLDASLNEPREDRVEFVLQLARPAEAGSRIAATKEHDERRPAKEWGGSVAQSLA
jgi:hypothetical protein